MSIPVYLSRHGDLPDEYGALVSWDIGQRVQFVEGPKDDPFIVTGVVLSETLEHVSAPTIGGARGEGRWVREIRCDDTGETTAVSEERLQDITEDPQQ